MNNTTRKTTRIIVAIVGGVRSFHFTASHLSGADSDTWHPIIDNNFFSSVETKLIEVGEAHNLVHLEDRGVFFEATYNTPIKH